MSIPMSCAGCGSAFDVPDNLAGKTIRCTACKAEMNVPQSAGSGETRKPFGSGAQSAAKAKPLVDEPARNSSNGKSLDKSAVAPKPGAKSRAVEEEDEDEDETEKTKAKSANKKAATKRRRDEDDDDDEEDERPTRKKRKNESGGSGAMIAIIGGGLVGLAAIVGLSIYLLTSGDDKKSSSASNTSNTSSANSNPAAPSPGTTPSPGANPAPGANPNPSTITPPAGMPPSTDPGGLPPGTGMTPGIGPGPGGLPPGPGDMNPGPGGPPVAGDNPFSRLKKDEYGTAGAWGPFSGDGFTADYPGTPETINENMPAPPPVGRVATKITILGSKKSGALVGVWLMPFPIDFSVVPGGPSKVLNDMISGMAVAGTLKLGPSRDVTVDGYPGKELSVEASEGKGTFRIVLAKNRAYFCFTMGKNADHPESRRFLDSVKITYKGGDQVAGLPGGMFPGPGGMPPGPNGLPPGPNGTPQNTGFQPNPGPLLTPPNTDGNQKARLDPFVAIAFDMDNKEFFTTELRSTRTGTAGTLRRSSYPDFRTTSTFKMPSVGFRMTIDAKGGRLYVATAATPTTPVKPFDGHRASVVGNVAVYDLKLLREGKNPEGKELENNGDVKPVTTINLASRIHGMELSEDGKNLYVLTSSPQSYKPSLVHIETATLKEVKRTKKELEEPVIDMVKSTDGKTLIILESLNLKTGSSGVLLFDPAAWTRGGYKSFSKAAVFDVAPLADGSMIVSTQPLGQNNAPPAAGPPMGMQPGALPGVPPVGAPGALPGLPPVGAPGALPGMPPVPGALPGMPPVGAPGALPGMPPVGGVPGQPGANPNPPQPSGPPQPLFRLVLLDSNGGEKAEMDLGAARRVTNSGFIEFDPANKKLFSSSWGGPGLDVYDVTDSTAASGLKLKTAVRTARRASFGGFFFMVPDGKYLVYQGGAVIDTADVGGSLGGQPIPPGPGGVQPGGPPNPGMPPAIGNPVP